MEKQQSQKPSLKDISLAAIRTDIRHERAHAREVNRLLGGAPRLRAPEAPIVN